MNLVSSYGTMKIAGYEGSMVQALFGALNPEGMKREKNQQVLRITAGQFRGFQKSSS